MKTIMDGDMKVGRKEKIMMYQTDLQEESHDLRHVCVLLSKSFFLAR